MSFEPILRVIDISRTERHPLAVYCNPLTQSSFSNRSSDCIPEGGAGEGAAACGGNHDVQAKSTFCSHKSRQRNDHSDGIGGNTFSRRVSAATPKYPSDSMVVVIHSNITFTDCDHRYFTRAVESSSSAFPFWFV